MIGPAPKCRWVSVAQARRSGRRGLHHEIAAMSIQPYSKASNENVNPDNAIIRIMRRSSEMERNDTDVITDRNTKVQTRTVVLRNVNILSTVFRLIEEPHRDRCRQREVVP